VNPERLWTAYLTLYFALYRLAAAVVPQNSAQKCACYTLGDLFYEATIGKPTMYGPWYRAFELMNLYLGTERALFANDSVEAVNAEIEIPSSEALCETAWAYATVYHAVLECQLSALDVGSLVSMIKLNTPKTQGDDDLGIGVSKINGAQVPIRRVFYWLERGGCSENLICEVAGVIWIREDKISQLWAKVASEVEVKN
jgi:hypothetical protein